MTDQEKKLIKKWLWNMDFMDLVDLHGTERGSMIDDIYENLDDDKENALDLLNDAKKWQAKKDDEIATKVLEDAMIQND